MAHPPSGFFGRREASHALMDSNRDTAIAGARGMCQAAFPFFSFRAPLSPGRGKFTQAKAPWNFLAAAS